MNELIDHQFIDLWPAYSTFVFPTEQIATNKQIATNMEYGKRLTYRRPESKGIHFQSHHQDLQ